MASFQAWWSEGGTPRPQPPPSTSPTTAGRTVGGTATTGVAGEPHRRPIMAWGPPHRQQLSAAFSSTPVFRDHLLVLCLDLKGWIDPLRKAKTEETLEVFWWNYVERDFLHRRGLIGFSSHQTGSFTKEELPAIIITHCAKHTVFVIPPAMWLFVVWCAIITKIVYSTTLEPHLCLTLLAMIVLKRSILLYIVFRE